MIFRVILPTLLLLIQIGLYWRTMVWLREVDPEWQWLRPIARILFGVFNAALILVFVFRPHVLRWPPWLIFTAMYPVYIWHGASLLLGVALLVIALVKLPFRIGLAIARRIPLTRQKLERLQSKPEFQRFDSGRRVFLRRSAAGLATLSFGSYAYGTFIGVRDYQLTEETFSIPHLHPGLSGFTIALISDIHSGVFMTRQEMEEYVRVVNGMNTDLIAVVGDFVTGSVEEVYPFGEAFSQLHAPYGVVGVTGNHEYYTEDPRTVIREVEQSGIRLLHDENLIISKNGGAFYLVGVDDPGRNQGSLIRLDESLANTSLAIPKILLLHRPYYLAPASRNNIDLVLSGHTHGGQIVLGKFGNTVLAPAALASPYVSGRYTMGSTSMYVSRGVGTVGLPVRINCPPEVTRITLIASERS